MLTLSNRGGSWYSTKLLLNEIVKRKKANVIICSGKPGYNIHCKNITHIHMDIVDPYKIHSLFINAPFISVFLFLPISLCGLILSIIHKPRLVIVNGVVPLLLLAPLKILSRDIFIILEYHGAVEDRLPRPLAKMLRVILNAVVDIAIVNSIGSYKDLLTIIDGNKIIIQEHVVDDEFFEKINKKELRYDMGIDDNKFIIAYIGHLTYEKGFDIFLRVMAKLINVKDILFIVVGDGPLRRFVESLAKNYNNVRYCGYISERPLLHKYYAIADLVWSYADETYLARPAAEALASGTPVILPNVPAVLIKRIKGKRISKKLIPKNVGFIVNHTNIEEIVKLILVLKKRRHLLEYMGESARKYAQKKYSSKHLKAVVDFILRKARLL